MRSVMQDICVYYNACETIVGGASSCVCVCVCVCMCVCVCVCARLKVGGGGGTTVLTHLEKAAFHENIFFLK